MEDDWEIVSKSDKNDYVNIIDVRDEQIANTILGSSISTLKYIPRLVRHTPKTIYYNILFQIIKYNVTNDWRVTVIVSFISLVIFFSKYRYLINLYRFILRFRCH